jgi:hypothetical protein
MQATSAKCDLQATFDVSHMQVFGFLASVSMSGKRPKVAPLTRTAKCNAQKIIIFDARSHVLHFMRKNYMPDTAAGSLKPAAETLPPHDNREALSATPRPTVHPTATRILRAMNASAPDNEPLYRYNDSADPIPAHPAINLPCVDAAAKHVDGVAAVGQMAQRADDQDAGCRSHADAEQGDTEHDDVVHDHACACADCQQTQAYAHTQKQLEHLFHDEFPEAKYIPDQDCTCDHQNWSSLDLQLNHFRCRPHCLQKRLKHIYNRVNYNLGNGEPGYWNRQNEWANYGALATIVALSRYERQDDFLQCGYHGYSCHDRLLCPRCVFNLLAKPALAEFGHAHAADQKCYFMVLSLSREWDETKRLIFKDLTISEMQQIKRRGQSEQGKLDNYGVPFEEPLDLCEAWKYWGKMAETIHNVTGRNRMFTGAFGGPELAVRFMPLAVLPHANYIVWSREICAGDVREVRRILREKLRGCRDIRPGLYPHVAVYRISSNDDLQRVIKYVFKPIALAHAYTLVASQLRDQPDQMLRLNEQVNFFFENIVIVSDGMHRMNRYGFCHASSKNYVGAVTETRRQRRIADAERRAEKKRADAERKQRFPEYKPDKRKKSKKEKSDEFLRQAEYKKMVRDGEIERKPPRRVRRQQMDP